MSSQSLDELQLLLNASNSEAGVIRPHDKAVFGKSGKTGKSGNTKAFRLNAKNLFLTYPHCESTPVQVLANVKLFFGDRLEYVVIGREKHKDGTPHLHIALGLTRKVNFRDPHVLDSIAGKHGNYLGMRDKTRCITYCVKGDDFVEFGINSKDFLNARKKHKSVKSEEVAGSIMQGDDLLSLNEQYPGFMLMNLPKVQTYQSWYQTCTDGLSKKGLSLPSVSPLGLSPAEIRIRYWLISNLIGLPKRPFKQVQLYLWGTTSLGKTSLLMAIESKYRVYWCPMDEDFYNGYDDKLFDIIVLDEFKSQKRLQFLNSFVQGSPVSLRVKGGQVMKRKNLPVIITSNMPLSSCYHKVAALNPVVMQSIEGRFEQVHLENDIFTLLDRLLI